MIELPLTQGKVVQLDDEDFDLVESFTWCAVQRKGNWHAFTNIPHPILKGRSASYYMHRLILGIPYGDPRKVDHENGNGLDNRRFNLRVATSQQNAWNRMANRNSTSRYKGVSWHKFRSGNGAWRAQLTVDGEKHRLGLFESEEEAAKACDQLMIKMHGDFARLNLPK